MKHFATNIFALNLEDPLIQQFLQEWYELTLNKTAFFSAFPEQIPVSILLQKNDISINNYSWREYFNINHGAQK